MPAKIRLQRFGKKGYAYYHIVVADVRAPRDGKFIERIGSYNPNTNPATIELNKEKAMEWLRKGAQPTDTTRAILSYQGVLYKYHLQRGVSKGMVTQEAADSKYDAWEAEKQAKIGNKVSGLSDAKREDAKKRLADEAKVREAKAKAIQDKLAADVAEAEAATAAAAAPAAEEEAPATEQESPASEQAGEAPAEN